MAHGNTDQVSALEAESARLRAAMDRLEAGMVDAGTWTAAEEAELERLNDLAWAAEDEIERIQARAALADAAFAAHVAATLQSPEPGPEYPGAATVWHGGREYFCDEVLALRGAAVRAA